MYENRLNNGPEKEEWLMRKERILAIVMAVFMALSLMPSMVLQPLQESGWRASWKLRGSAAVGSELSADFEKYSRKG